MSAKVFLVILMAGGLMLLASGALESPAPDHGPNPYASGDSGSQTHPPTLADVVKWAGVAAVAVGMGGLMLCGITRSALLGRDAY